ncbi:hypothetical protein DOM22_17420 [Bdellovibrio sp. ZAP7]|uniref:hypothetical protein n=1 Tax=Bdellovibrio sp. ZAP7 TaxID=2231053 RepID=UPI001159C241|nr:hypothetical protein [Bdellovibrio sp. ZAP7]QDK46809.1 hypothetical protein DOM22_17420 [Bdellovibrio sp. ZAP7]
MKKNIIASMVMLSFLIGCSFSKDSNKVKTQQITSPPPEDIFSIVKRGSIDDLIEELKKYTPYDLTYASKDGRSLLQVSVDRGSTEVASILLNAGASPYYPNSNGKSFYSSFEDSNVIGISIEAHIAKGSTSYLAKEFSYSRPDKIQYLIRQVNQYLLPCDQTLVQLLNSSEGHANISLFLSEVKNCEQTTIRKNVKYIFESATKNFLVKDNISGPDYLKILNTIPESFKYDLINVKSISKSSSWEIGVHPEVVLNILRKYYPNKIDPILAELQKKRTNNEAAFALVSSEEKYTPMANLGEYFRSPNQYSLIEESIIQKINPVLLEDDEDIL